MPNPADRAAEADWSRIAADLDTRGYAVLDRLVSPPDCLALAALYAEESLFRKTVVMAQHGYGRGEYKYFAAPLPAPIGRLRAALYAGLAPLADDWSARLGCTTRYPAKLEQFSQACHAAGQRQPTPLLLRYGPGDYNCLHQDLYGPLAFPFQVAILLSDPAVDFSGGEFVLLEQSPRRQSRAEVVPIGLGDALIFAVRHRPIRGPRGFSRVTLKHGVSPLRSGERFVAGIIFHDAA